MMLSEETSAVRPQKQTRFNGAKLVWMLKGSPLTVTSAVIIVLMLLMMIFSPWLATHAPNAIDLTARLLPPSAAHWFGTDEVGRDLFSRVLVGSQQSILAGLVVVAIAGMIGSLLGCLSGVLGGRADAIIMRIMDIMLSIPSLVLTMALASSMGNISFFFPKAKQGSALGINGGLGNLGVSVMQLVAPLVIFVPVFAFLGVNGVPQADGSVMSLANAAWIWVPLLAIATIAAWSGMNDIASSRASIADQLPVLQRLHLWLLSLLYLATFGSFIGFSAGFAMLAKTQFPDVNILRLAFFGPFIGAIARSVGGAISDKFGGVRVTLINFIFMAIFSALLFLTLPGTGSGNFIAFYAVFMGLFLTAGLGSGSTFQMIAVIFRQITIYRVKMKGGSDEQAQKEAVTETAAALGFISAIGAVGGFFIPQAFGMSLNMTGSPVGAMKVFLIFYIVCVLLTWLVYGRRKFSQK
ncbi:hypothetical protein FRO14_12600 [Escherichia coli]|nr:hypothetical protein [Escherichia coli]